MQNTLPSSVQPSVYPTELGRSSLDIPETSVRDSGYGANSSLTSDYRNILRDRTKGEYNRAYKLYHLATGRLQSKHCKRLNMCGSAAQFLRHKETGQIKVASSACHLRFCPICAKRRSLEVTERILNWMGKKEVIRFITLTQKHSNRPLRVQIDDLIKSWRKLYKGESWQRYVTAGVWALQVTYNKDNATWHPHLHMLVRGKYYPQEILSQDWLKASGNSFITDCRRVGSKKKAAEYIGRYVGRASSLDKIPESEYVNYYWGLNGKRLFGEFGTGKGDERLLAKVKRSDLDEWEKLANWDDVIKSMPFDKQARLIYKAWKTNTPLQKILKIPKRIVDYNLQGDFQVWEFPELECFSIHAVQ